MGPGDPGDPGAQRTQGTQGAQGPRGPWGPWDPPWDPPMGRDTAATRRHMLEAKTLIFHSFFNKNGSTLQISLGVEPPWGPLKKPPEPLQDKPDWGIKENRYKSISKLYLGSFGTQIRNLHEKLHILICSSHIFMRFLKNRPKILFF